MTVDELQDELSKLPGDTVVMLIDINSGGSDLFEVTGVGQPEDTDGINRIWLSGELWEG